MSALKRIKIGMALLVASLTFSSPVCAAIIYDFDIRVNFDGGLTASQQSIFSQAELFWETLIIGYRDEYAGPGLDISASGPAIDGPGGILGQAGPTFGIFLPTYVYATAGIMQFDAADLLNLEAQGSLLDVIIHEMAHVIGFGTLWSAPFNDVLDVNGNYVGAYGLAAYQLSNPGATFVPVEQGGGPGTAGGHWDETDGGGDPEIMTGWLDFPSSISLTTINSFADLGYVINPDYAVNINQVPAPSALALLLLGLFGLRKKLRN
ncbi:leishmanolysin-related zinc metalloendopeptidase [Rheinheimera maricola]|uniref:Peptidase n=1 Tax=Rheinheimera maricola TaxID=2793282 RepID=A0ABS7XF97_9GAMM|nr:leishmanolysin-related zinc metalloendopeptidase [Rheinheimera maricola]MBZ9613407.1 hypothetical protein [Rheinheimera maricola]